MLLFKTNNPKITAIDVTRVANVRNLIPYFNRNRHNLQYEYEESMNMFHIKKNNFMIDTSTVPRILSQFINNKKSPPVFGDKIEVKLQRRALSNNPMEENYGYHGDWVIEPGMTCAIMCIETYNMASKVYKIETDESISFELCSGYMIIVDNPDKETRIKFPALRRNENIDFADPYEDTLLIRSYK